MMRQIAMKVWNYSNQTAAGKLHRGKLETFRTGLLRAKSPAMTSAGTKKKRLVG
jgi:hypothetical protein